MNKYPFLIPLLFLLFNCRYHDAPKAGAIVMAGYIGTPGAMIDGAPAFAAVGQALAAVPEVNKNPFIIYIRKGCYYEKLSVDKANVHFLGESRDETIIRYDATGDTPNPDGEPGAVPRCESLHRIFMPKI